EVESSSMGSKVKKKLDLSTSETASSSVEVQIQHASKETAGSVNGTVKPVHAASEVVTMENNQPKEAANKKGKAWTNLFQRNRAVENGMSLAYIPPQLIDGQVVVQLDKNEVDLETEKWK
ncbi:hypothetical protein A4A49_56496, partial [Nicotiana attenuata]